MYKKEPDRRAPRFRGSKYRYTSINRDLFSRFCEAYPKLQMDYLVFKDILCSINEEYVDEVVNNKDGVYLPKGLGRLCMVMFKPKKINKHETYILDGLVTNGLSGKIVWEFRDVKYRPENIKYYAFVAHRTFKNKASHSFRTRPEFYPREETMIKKEEFYKMVNSERAKINSQISDQSSEDAEQSSIFGQ